MATFLTIAAYALQFFSIWFIATVLHMRLGWYEPSFDPLFDMDDIALSCILRGLYFTIPIVIIIHTL